MFPFTPELAGLLEAQRARTEAISREIGRIIPYMFHRRGVVIKSIRGAWRSACRAAGLPGRIPHDFRRTAVRNLERAGVPRPVAMKMVGMAEGEGFEPPRAVRPGGFQDDSAMIPNPPSFLSSRRLRSLPTSAEVGSREVLVEARGHRMGTSEKIRFLVARRGCSLPPAFGLIIAVEVIMFALVYSRRAGTLVRKPTPTHPEAAAACWQGNRAKFAGLASPA